MSSRMLASGTLVRARVREFAARRSSMTGSGVSR